MVAIPANLRVKYAPIADVRPYEDNPRHNDEAVEAVAASIREFGWKQPIVVDPHYASATVERWERLTGKTEVRADG